MKIIHRIKSLRKWFWLWLLVMLFLIAIALPFILNLKHKPHTQVVYPDGTGEKHYITAGWFLAELVIVPVAIAIGVWLLSKQEQDRRELEELSRERAEELEEIRAELREYHRDVVRKVESLNMKLLTADIERTRFIGVVKSETISLFDELKKIESDSIKKLQDASQALEKFQDASQALEKFQDAPQALEKFQDVKTSLDKAIKDNRQRIVRTLRESGLLGASDDNGIFYGDGWQKIDFQGLKLIGAYFGIGVNDEFLEPKIFTESDLSNAKFENIIFGKLSPENDRTYSYFKPYRLEHAVFVSCRFCAIAFEVENLRGVQFTNCTFESVDFLIEEENHSHDIQFNNSLLEDVKFTNLEAPTEDSEYRIFDDDCSLTDVKFIKCRIPELPLDLQDIAYDQISRSTLSVATTSDETEEPVYLRRFGSITFEGGRGPDRWEFLAELKHYSTQLAQGDIKWEVFRSKFEALSSTGFNRVVNRLEAADIKNDSRYELNFSQFQNIDFSGLNLRELDFSNSRFKNCRFISADLCGARLADVKFENCDFRNAVLKDVDLSNAEFDVDSHNTDIIYSKFKLVNVRYCNLNPSSVPSHLDVDLAIVWALQNYEKPSDFIEYDSDLSDSAILDSFLEPPRSPHEFLLDRFGQHDVRNGIEIKDICFEEVLLTGELQAIHELKNFTFVNCTFTNVNFKAIRFENVKFSDCRFNTVRFEGVSLINTEFNKGEVENVSIGPLMPPDESSAIAPLQCKLEECDFVGVIISGLTIRSATIHNSRFRDDTEIKGNEIIASKMTAVRFENTILDSFDLKQVNFSEVGFYDSTLKDLEIISTGVTESKSKDYTIDDKTRLRNVTQDHESDINYDRNDSLLVS